MRGAFASGRSGAVWTSAREWQLIIRSLKPPIFKIPHQTNPATVVRNMRYQQILSAKSSHFSFKILTAAPLQNFPHLIIILLLKSGTCNLEAQPSKQRIICTARLPAL